MAKRKLMFLLGSICILLIVAGIIYSNWSTGNTDITTQDTATDNSMTGDNIDVTTDDSTTGEDIETTTDTSTNTDHSSSSITSDFSSTTVDEALASNNDDHEDDEDYTWDSSDVTTITLNTNSICVDVENGIIIDGKTVTVTSAGTYNISGTLNDGQIIVDTYDEEVVRLILNGVTISSSTNAPIYVANADKTVIVLAPGTENYLTDNKNNQENATILSKDDLTIYGDGSLIVSGKDNDAIHSNDGLVIKSGTITVTSVDDGICGKDYLVINDGDITVNSVGDGLKSNNDEEEARGYIYIEDGTITVTSGQGDAITAQTDLLITGGTFTLTSGGGSSATRDADMSTKGLKAGVGIIVDGGDFTIGSSDDAIHSNGVIVINSGTFDVFSGDDGIHADKSIEINDGTFDISQSFEGMESATVTINDGYIQINSSDDGINLVGVNDGSTQNGGGWQGGGFRGGGGGGFETAGDYYLYIRGGYIYIDSNGDGIDSNGYIEMSDGILIINGPTSNMNGAIDYGGGSFTLTGGTLVAVGSAGMAQAPSSSSTQYSANLGFGSAQSANVLVHIQTASGEDVLTFCPTKPYQSLVFSSPELAAGTYYVYVGGSSTGTSTNGLFQDGTYSGGTNLGSFTLS